MAIEINIFVNTTIHAILWNFACGPTYPSCGPTYPDAGQDGPCLPSLQKPQFCENYGCLICFSWQKHEQKG